MNTAVFSVPRTSDIDTTPPKSSSASSHTAALLATGVSRIVRGADTVTWYQRASASPRGATTGRYEASSAGSRSVAARVVSRPSDG